MSVQRLDLTTIEGFHAAVSWIRTAIILQPKQPGFYEIEATTKPGSSCNVFMTRSDAYLVAFRGRDKLYALADSAENHEERLHAAGFDDGGGISTLGLSVTHPALGTLGHTFHRAELQAAASILSGFSERDGSFQTLRKPLSLLVCVLAEAARSPAIAFEFQHLWTARICFEPSSDTVYEERSFAVRANEAIQCYDKAIRITQYADRYFKRYIRALDRLTKLEKRAVEVRDLLRSLGAALTSGGNRQQALDDLLKDPASLKAPGREFEARRLHDIGRELEITSGKELTDFAGLCGEQVAMEFARSGVVARDLAPSRH